MELRDRTSNKFDLIRLLAAASVIATHSRVFLGLPEEDLARKLTGSMTFSFLGVATFFALSGFLVTQSLQDSPLYGRFYRKRALRLCPGLLGVVLFSTLILGPLCTSQRVFDYF